MEVHEPIKRDRNLNITVIADDSAFGRTAVQHGVQLAEVFQASLTVMANFDLHLPDKPSIPGKEFIDELQNIILNAKNGQVITDYVFPETLFRYADEHNTAMFVIGVDKNAKEGFFNVKKAIKLIRQSRFPVMTVTTNHTDTTCYKHILLPLDIERQNKEKALWAGYFSRFYGSVIHILYPKYRDEGLVKLVHDNVAFVEKLYENLEITYEKHETQPHNYLDAYALEFAPQVNAGASVIMMTRYYTLADVLTGPRERKIIGSSELPILCINQRDDLYVLCT
ncbi:MAG: universal stress protein [Bacteroidales bacterium]|nr:universal stress protein [Bacteroidales bacterium]